MQGRIRNLFFRSRTNRSLALKRRKSLRGVQHLESRQLLSADIGEAWIGDAVDMPEKSIAPQPEVRLEQQMQTAADAGGSLSTAWELGELDGPQSLRGYVGWWDSRDLYRFSLSGEAEIDLRLDQLGGDIDLALHDVNGRRLATSARGGNSTEQLQGTLAAGTYYVNIEPWGWADSTYRLVLDAQLTALPTPEPDDGITPLPDAPTYGGSDEWNLNTIAAPEAWQAGYTGVGVTVAVVDTGIDLNHVDLVSSLWVNPGEVPGNGADDDANGFIDDYHGWDFFSSDNTAEDGNGHGTHVAGTVVASRNGHGATGVASGVQLMPVRVLGDGGSGAVSNVAAGIRYAADNGARIINLSLGGGYSSEIAAAIDYAGSLGSFVVTAAGNASGSEPSYPARHSATMSHVISVGAHDQHDVHASFSNGVGASGAVQVDAPGVNIFSTYADDAFARLSGTSMAAPHVAGLAALALGASPEDLQLSSTGLRELLVAGATRAITGSDAVGGIDAAMTVAMAAAGMTGFATDAAATTTATSSTVDGVSAQSLTRFSLMAPAPAAHTHRLDDRFGEQANADPPQRLDARQALLPHDTSIRAERPSASPISRVDVQDASLLEALKGDDEASTGSNDALSGLATAAQWQQAVDNLLRSEST